MPKITRFGGASSAPLNETDGGFTDDTAATLKTHGARASNDPTGEGFDDTGAPIAGSDPVQAEKLEGERRPNEDASTVDPPFDPAELSVTEVNELLADATDEERDAVLASERDGKKRKGIIGE